MTYKILVVDDEKELNKVIVSYLKKEGYETDTAFDGFEALKLMNTHLYHIVILDVMMPGIDGFDVLSEFRKFSDTPVIMLTAKALEEDVVDGFSKGADDYVTKPFSNKELMLRIKVILRRQYQIAHTKSYENLSLDFERMVLIKDGVDISLTHFECELLKVFFSHVDQVLTREQLLKNVFDNYEGYDRNIDSYIKRLRHKIEEDPKHPRYIHTKYGAGYMFGGRR